MQFKIGSDPEVFVGDASGVRSIIGKVGGTKRRPLPLPIGEGFAVQEDNVALEFNIPASSGRAEFVRNITAATAFLEQAMTDRYGYKFVRESAVSFPDSELQTPEALVFGCDPDFNAWTGMRNPRPESNDKNLRSCGGHVHVGNIDVDPMLGARACDLFLGVPSCIMDKGEKRRMLYGKGGATRKKPYGFEYRTLSNFWIFHPRLIEWVYDNTERALELASTGESLESEREAILDAIDNNNKKAALMLINKFNLGVVHA